MTVKPETIPEEKLQEEKLIGSGGFGQVYKAWHVDWGYHVALKKLNTKHVHQHLEELLSEAEKMMSTTSIDHVLRMYGLCRYGDGSYGLVMEYMENGSLTDLQQSVKPLPWSLKFRILHEISLGMNRMHNLTPSLLHLDLKPQNVLVNEDLRIKISDFGLSRFKRGITLPQDDLPADGTLEFMAPELLRDVNASPTKASDVYSYAILIWCVLTGKEPYSSAKSSLIKLHIPCGQRPSLELLQSIDHVEKLVDMQCLMEKCWNQEPSQRPSFKDCVNTTRKVFGAHKHQADEAVRKVKDALTKMESCSEQEREKMLSYRPSSTAPSSSYASSILENFTTLTLEQPPSYMNEAVPLPCTSPPMDPSNRKPQAYKSTFSLPHTARPQGAQQRILHDTTQSPSHGTGAKNITIKNVKFLQIGDNNSMERCERKSKLKK